jgi:hypothetical protein
LSTPYGWNPIPVPLQEMLVITGNARLSVDQVLIGPRMADVDPNIVTPFNACRVTVPSLDPEDLEKSSEMLLVPEAKVTTSL